jgi:circadian clock protein KaiC
MNSTTETRLSSGIPGLDQILHGGLPAQSLYLIQGDPGVGKTTLALQFLRAGALKGLRCLYITLAETQHEVELVVRSHGWNLEGIDLFDLSKIEQHFEPEAVNTVFHPAEIELTQISQILITEIERIQPSIVVFDSLSELRLLAQNSLRYRRQLLSLKNHFSRIKCTALVLDDKTSEIGDLQVQSIAHGVIALERINNDYGMDRRRLSIVKLRGATYRSGYHDFVIETGGIKVFPRLIASEIRHIDASTVTVSSGDSALDALLGGGLDRGTSTLLMGPAGAGKSSLSTLCAIGAARRKEKSSFFMFDENLTTFKRRSHSLGLDVNAAIENGLIELTQVDPAEMSPGEFAQRLRIASENGSRQIVIDSLNGYMHAMPAESYLMLQLHELLAYLNQRGAITLMTAAQQGLVGPMQTPFDLTYLADTVLLFRFFEFEGEVRKALSVIKKRSGNHERTIREILMSKTGISIGKCLKDFQGILTGTPRFRGTAQQILSHE